MRKLTYETLADKLKECKNSDEVLDVFNESDLGIWCNGGDFGRRYKYKKLEDGMLFYGIYDGTVMKYTLVSKSYPVPMEICIDMPKKRKQKKEPGLIKKLLTGFTGG